MDLIKVIQDFLMTPSFVESFMSNLLADVIIAVAIGIIVVRYLDNKEKKRQKTENEQQRKEKLHLVVEMLWQEIEHNRSQLKIMIENLPNANLPYPALETATWELIDKSLILDGLKLKDIKNLVNIYNRVKTINMMYYMILDKVNWIEEKKRKPVIKGQVMGKLVDRCEELLSYINEVIPEKIKK